MGSDRDIVERLRDGSRKIKWSDDRVRLEAASTIETLRAEIMADRAIEAHGNEPITPDIEVHRAEHERLVRAYREAQAATDSTGALGKEGRHGQV